MGGRSSGHQRRQPEEWLEGQGEQGSDGNRQRLGGPQHQDAGEERGQTVRLRAQPFGRGEDAFFTISSGYQPPLAEVATHPPRGLPPNPKDG